MLEANRDMKETFANMDMLGADLEAVTNSTHQPIVTEAVFLHMMLVKFARYIPRELWVKIFNECAEEIKKRNL